MTTAAEGAAAALRTEMPLDSRLAIGRAKIKAFRWPKGQTGRTPSAKLYHEARRIARQAAPAMMHKLVDLAQNSEDDRVASVCAIAVLDRASIRPIDFDPNEERGTKPRFNPRHYTPEELDLIQAALKLLVRPRSGGK
jgi:hypothetical protein